MLSVSVVIPTRNREENLLKTLVSLKGQDYPLLEVLVVDSSDLAPVEENLKSLSGISGLRLIRSEPSVCLQRNIGIKASKGDFVFLLDDDISLDNKYVSTIVLYMEKHPERLISSGLVLEKDSRGEWQYKQIPPHPLKLLWIYLFQLGLWSQLSDQQVKWPWKTLNQLMRKYYQELGNGISKAGWPVISNFNPAIFKTKIYGLGASILHREWLIEHLYDEILDRHGIGDNYGIAIALPAEQHIHVITEIKAFHHKSPANRLTQAKTYYYRILALDYFSRQHKSASRSWLCWSILGNALSSILRGHWGLFSTNLTLIWLIGTNQNPLLNKKSTPDEVA